MRKGISPVVATALLLIVSVVAVVGFNTWFSSYQSKALSNIEQSSKSSGSLEIDNLIGTTLYIKNPTTTNLSLKTVKIGNSICTINQNFGKGIFAINVSGCMNNTMGVVSVLLISNSSLREKKIFIKPRTKFSSVSGNVSSNVTLPPVVPGYSFNSFLSVWNTANSGVSGSNQITLPLEATGTYNFTVKWGDGTSNSITSWNQPQVTHTYASSGTYTVNMTGLIRGFSFGSGISDASKLVDITHWGGLHLGNSGYYFANSNNLLITANDVLNLSGTTTLSNMFNSYQGVSISNMEYWDVSHVTDMSGMFSYTNNFNGNINSWNVSSVTDMSSMFYMAHGFSQFLNNWDVSHVTNMGGMFAETTSFSGSGIESWDVSHVTNMGSMFDHSSSFNANIGSWNVGSVTAMNSMFDGSNFNYDISGWDVSHVENMNVMFNGGTFNQDISGWDVSHVTSMFAMLSWMSNFNQDLSSWNVSSVVFCNGFGSSSFSWSSAKPNFTACTP